MYSLYTHTHMYMYTYIYVYVYVYVYVFVNTHSIHYVYSNKLANKRCSYLQYRNNSTDVILYVVITLQ